MLEHQALDELDIQIIKHLQQNARASHSDIAAELQVSKGTVRNRILRMEEMGVIRGYNVALNPAYFGYSETAFLKIGVRDAIAKVVAANIFRITPRVVEIHITTGEYPILVKVQVRDTADLGDTIQKIRAVGGVAPIETEISTYNMAPGFDFRETGVMDAIKAFKVPIHTLSDLEKCDFVNFDAHT